MWLKTERRNRNSKQRYINIYIYIYTDPIVQFVIFRYSALSLVRALSSIQKKSLSAAGSTRTNTFQAPWQQVARGTHCAAALSAVTSCDMSLQLKMSEWTHRCLWTFLQTVHLSASSALNERIMRRPYPRFISQTTSHTRICTVCSSSFNSRDSSVSIVTTLHGDAGIESQHRQRHVFSRIAPDYFWGLPSVLSNWCRGILPRKQCGRSLKLANDVYQARG